jgi:hypothetical protein
MKTCWKSITTDKEARAKQLDLEACYGVPFTRYSTGDGMRIRPCIDASTKQSFDEGNKIGGYLIGKGMKNWQFIAFDRIAEDTGIGIKSVLEICNYLIHTGALNGDVGRSGAVVGVHPNHV